MTLPNARYGSQPSHRAQGLAAGQQGAGVWAVLGAEQSVGSTIMSKYDNDICSTFAQDMEDAGYEVTHYHGRNYWQGPAVRVESNELQSVIRATKVRVQTDAMGRTGIVVYPVRSGKFVADEAEAGR